MSTAPGVRRGISVGSIDISRVTEWAGPLFSRTQLLPQSTREQWDTQRQWLVPEFWDPATDAIQAALQTHVIRIAGRTIVVDTGIGNHKHRPSTPPLDGLHGPYLERLRQAGVEPADVDTVVCTHLHPDHVGWNTRYHRGRWVPTFPRARYVLPAADYTMLQDMPAAEDGMNYRDALADSIQPIVDNDQADFWDGDAIAIAAGVRALRTPGHSPGSSVVVVESDSHTAIVSGDIVHHPMQILYPDQPTSFDSDPAAAAACRRRILQLAVDTDAILLPAHFAGPRVVRIGNDQHGFRIEDWVTVPD